jgi:nitrate reductase (cytochrome), electron transfer subunit
MSEGKTSPGCALLILASFVVLALGVARLIEHRLSHQGLTEHGKVWEQPQYLSHANQSHDPVTGPIQNLHMGSASEAGMYHSSPTADINDSRREGAKVRRLAEFYSRRAYPGAPPYVPHPVANQQLMADRCTTCHEKGGYVPMYNAYAPVSPHPEKENCRQCHVTQANVMAFVESNWIKPQPPKRGQSMLGGSPPRIPHTLQLRENCLSCHSGPAAVEEIRVSHPQRENCRQCHVPQTTTSHFTTTYGVQGDAP